MEVLDGDILRQTLSKGLSFSKEDRDANVCRSGFVANLLNRNGINVIVAAISPYRSIRAEVREAQEKARFVDHLEDRALVLPSAAKRRVGSSIWSLPLCVIHPADASVSPVHPLPT